MKFQKLTFGFTLAFCIIAMLPSRSEIRPVEKSRDDRRVSFVVCTDRARYSLADTVRLYAFIENSQDSEIYVDRRMFWTGYSGGLKLVIADEQGKYLPAKVLSDAMMPPPKEGDTDILVRLDEGHVYGSTLGLQAKGFFPKPGKYSVRVIYKSWLDKDFVAPSLRKLPAIWADSPEMPSEPVFIEVTP